MKRTLCTLIVALVMVLPFSVFAQDQKTTTDTTAAVASDEGRDLLELNLYGGLSLPTGGLKNFGDTLGAKVGFNGGFDFGAFVKQNIVVGLSFSYNQFGIDNTNPLVTQKHRVYSPKAYAKYYFQSESDFVPYVKVHAGADFAKLSTVVVDGGTFKFRELSYSPAFAFGIGGGFFMYTSDYSGFFMEANYHYAQAEKSDKVYKNKTYDVGQNFGLIDVHAGVHILFGSGE